MRRIWLARGESAQHFEPIVVHESADGRLRFPGTTDAPMPPGFVRKEIRTMREYETFARKVNRIERSKIEAMTEQDHMQAMRTEDDLRGDLRMAMQHMTPLQRDFAMHAIQYTNDHRMKSHDAGFYVEAMEMDQGNREAYRDERTNWKSKRK